jgi:TctA family transporter
MTLAEKIRAAAIGFITTLFASMIPGMKRGQTSAVALQISSTTRNEEVLFMLSLVSLAFVTLSIFALGSAGKVRSTLAYDINDVMGNIYFSQTSLFAGSVAISACMSACVLIFLAKPVGRIFSKINKKYLNAFGFCIGMLLIIIFTGINGVLLTFTATSIGLLSSRMKVRSAHLMGVLLLPSIVTAIL